MNDVTSSTLPPEQVPYQFLVLSVIPKTDEPEYREYIVDAEDLPELLQDIQDPRVAEMVVDIDTQFLADPPIAGE